MDGTKVVLWIEQRWYLGHNDPLHSTVEMAVDGVLIGLIARFLHPRDGSDAPQIARPGQIAEVLVREGAVLTLEPYTVAACWTGQCVDRISSPI